MTTHIRRIAAFGGALAISPYLIIKVIWAVGALLGLVDVDPGFSVAGWVALNLATVGMAGCGVALALALARPRGRRLPARLVLAIGWFGTGFLVPLLPYLAATPFLAQDSGRVPGWESVLFNAGMAGYGLAIVIALPLYLLEDRPDILHGDLRTLAPVNAATAVVATVTSGAVGVLTAWWAMGGTAGLAHPESRDTAWYWLITPTAVLALAGAAATAAIASRPRRAPRWPAIAVAWTSSGMLTAWSAWKLPLVAALAANPAITDVPWPEDLTVAAAQYVVGVVAGVTTVATLRAATTQRLEHVIAN